MTGDSSADRGNRIRALRRVLSDAVWMEPTEEGDWGRIAIMMALAFALVGISVYIRYSYGINLNFPRPQWFHSFFGTVGAITFGFALRMMLVKSRGNQNV